MLEQIKLAFGLESLELRGERTFEWLVNGNRYCYQPVLIEEAVPLYIGRLFWKMAFRPDWSKMMAAVVSAIRQTI